MFEREGRVENAASENAETVILTVSTNAGYTIGTPSTALVSIADSDYSSQTFNLTHGLYLNKPTIDGENTRM